MPCSCLDTDALFPDNPQVIPETWHRWLSRSRRWAACVVAVAVLLAPGLHQHADGGGAHQDCYTCSQLSRDTAPPPASVLLPEPDAILVVMGEARVRTPRSFLQTTRRARGPPGFIA